MEKELKVGIHVRGCKMLGEIFKFKCSGKFKLREKSERRLWEIEGYEIRVVCCIIVRVNREDTNGET